ncbi:MAG: M23 family metallopeptidase [Sandaracinaceae bacterium]|nr:M23 family metallopeptidase [Sandaracinaceae bacterium]
MRGAAIGLLLCAMATPAAAQVGPLRPDPIEPPEYAPPAREACYARPTGSDGTVARARVCDGPRRVPLPDGEAARRAEALGLGGRPAADRLRIGHAPEAWLASLDGPPPDDLLWPVARGLFSRGFGHVRRAEIRHRRHDGLDIVAEAGAHVRAANDGLVVYADNGVRGYGNLLVLLHVDGSATLYAHCQAIYVAPGQLVRRGQVVGEVGATGLPVVPHLHFEWRRGGVPRDPLPALVERPDAAEIRPDAETRFATPPPNVVRPVVSSGVPATIERRGTREEEARGRDLAARAAEGRRAEPAGGAEAEPRARAPREVEAAERGARGG